MICYYSLKENDHLINLGVRRFSCYSLNKNRRILSIRKEIPSIKSLRKEIENFNCSVNFFFNCNKL